MDFCETKKKIQALHDKIENAFINSLLDDIVKNLKDKTKEKEFRIEFVEMYKKIIKCYLFRFYSSQCYVCEYWDVCSDIYAKNVKSK